MLSVKASWACVYAVFVSFSFMGFNPSVTAVGLRKNNETDKQALIDINAKITDDPFHVLSSWNDSIHFCRWHGVRCGRRHQRVRVLDLESQGLTGSVSPSIGNLNFLIHLYLDNNSLSQAIPPEIGHLTRLQYLWLNNNSFTGEMPQNISACSNLRSVDLSNNKLEGSIPSELGSWLRVEEMFLGNNNLSNGIPVSFGNLSSLVKFSAGYNHLKGSIPASLGQLKKLEYIELFTNNLSGIIPPTIYNLSSLVLLDLSENKLQGTLPGSIGYTLPQLGFLGLGGNQLTGELPPSVSNMSTLERLFLNSNGFTGQVPDVRYLNMLNMFMLTDNRLGSGRADDLRFISELTNATGLEVLAINGNRFGGTLPRSLGNLTNLVRLLMDNNQIYGNIPNEIGNLYKLKDLQLWSNSFTGTVPRAIGKLENLVSLGLSLNRFTGRIPSSLGNLSMCNELDLSGNALEGEIPPTLGNCQSLLTLDISENKLTGNIPSQVLRISSLSIYLSFYSNRLTGPLPREVGSLKNLGRLDLSNNLLSGEIPSSLRRCTSLEMLYMNKNFFQGTIPSSLSSLHAMQYLDLSNNNLSGEIPTYFGDMKLEYLNLSFNNFNGLVPEKGILKDASVTSLSGNPKLCGGVPDLHLPRCQFTRSKKHISNYVIKLVAPLVVGVLVLGMVLGILYLPWFKKAKKDTTTDSVQNKFLDVSYHSLLQATERFSEENLLGAGSFGSVYKGNLDGTIIAVKVLNLSRRGASKSFLVECEALRNIRHRNLVKVLSACSGIDYKGNGFKALVYEFMENGSLDEWLHPSSIETKSLNFLQRLNIAIDVANALDYLHNHCGNPIIHCDLKPGNVLLDKEFTAHVGDFGLAGLLASTSQHPQTTTTSSLGVRGSIGYTAPEYGIGSELSASGDVYSFGILLLEMFTGKRPTDEMFEGGLTVHKFVKDALPDRVEEISDPVLFLETEEATNITRPQRHSMRAEKLHDSLISVLKIGLHCSAENASDRMSTGDVVPELVSVRKFLLKAGT